MGAAATRVVGTVVMRPLSDVQVNSWNPNRMTSFMKESLKHGLQSDGWLSSQALLVWGKDDKGKKRNVVIDGEHRLVAATELGFPEGPMVFLDGLAEAQAKALTIKMNQKRGDWDEVALSDLLRDIQSDEASLGGGAFGPDLGFEVAEVARLLSLESGSFLDGFAETSEDKDESVKAEPSLDPSTGEEYLSFSFRLSSTQHSLMVDKLKLCKSSVSGVSTNVDALIHILGAYTGKETK